MNPAHPRLRPVYKTPGASDPIRLYTGSIELRKGAYVGAGSGTINLIWRVLGPEVRFEIPSLQPVNYLETADCTLTAGPVQGDVPAFLSEVNVSGGTGGEGVGVRGYPRRNILTGIEQPVAQILFHVVNYWPFLNPRPDPAPSDYHVGRVVFEGDGWRVTLQSVERVSRLHELVQGDSAFGITHVGRAERVDGTLFSRGVAHQLLHALHAFLSFTRGMWSPPILFVGLDVGGTPVWEDWTTRKASPGREVLTWFPVHGPECLGVVFPGFMNLWQNPATREILEVAIHWYVEANMVSAAIEGSVILAQTGLERLAYYILVHDRSRLAERDFQPGGLSAAERLRGLFNEFGLPLVIAPALRISALPALAVARSWTDAPHALVQLRNCIVHPDQRNLRSLEAIPVDARREAWMLCLWYYEVVLLKWFGYSGAYVNRLTVTHTGHTEPVP
jgi:hypothetical protein